MLPKRCRITPSHRFSSPQFHPQRNGFQKNMHLNLDHFPIPSSKPTYSPLELPYHLKIRAFPKGIRILPKHPFSQGLIGGVRVTASPPQQLATQETVQTQLSAPPSVVLSNLAPESLRLWATAVGMVVVPPFPGSPTKASILIHRLKFPSFTFIFLV